VFRFRFDNALSGRIPMNIRDVAMEKEGPTVLVLPHAAAGERWGIWFATAVLASVREWKHRLFDNPKDTVVQQ
jgi:hypothetical protein